jgi:hypothetical protein
MSNNIPQFTHEVIEGANGPCRAYTGIAAAITTFNGVPVIVMAASRSALVDVIKEISPNTNINPALFLPGSIIHDAHVRRKEDSL